MDDVQFLGRGPKKRMLSYLMGLFRNARDPAIPPFRSVIKQDKELTESFNPTRIPSRTCPSRG